MNNWIKRYQPLLVLLLLITAITPYLYISMYCNPIADDFIGAMQAREHDLINQLLIQYQRWSGRYASVFFILLNPMEEGSFAQYKLIPMLVIIATVVAMYLFIKTITSALLNPVNVLNIALIITLLFLYQMPIISEGIYWFSGAMTYQLGIIFLLIYTTVLILFLQHKHILKNKTLHIVLLIGALFVAIGINEISMIALLTLSAIIVFISYKNKTTNKNSVLFLVLLALLFAFISLSAPGNFARSSYFKDNHQFFNSVYLATLQTARFFIQWISSPPLLILSVLYYFLNKHLSSEDSIFSKSFYLSPLATLSILFFSIFIGSFPAYWSMGIMGQHRTMNISYFLFLICWFINLTVLFNWKQPSFIEKTKHWQVLLFMLAWCLLVFTKNGNDVFNDLRTGSAKAYDLEMTSRYELLKSSNDSIYFTAIKNHPKTLFVLDITQDPNNWINKAYGKAFKTNGKVKVVMMK